jgi:hypothetical protein
MPVTKVGIVLIVNDPDQKAFRIIPKREAVLEKVSVGSPRAVLTGSV